MKAILGATMSGVLVILAAGCAGMGGGMSDEEGVQAALAAWAEASVAKDVDGSENFSHDEYDYVAEDKAEMREFIEESLDMGSYDDLIVEYEADAISIEDGTAEVYPIDWMCAPGSATVTLTLKKEGKVWRITDAAVEEM